MDEWTAKVSLGRAEATFEGSGQIDLLDLIADAVGASGVELTRVSITQANEFLIGYDLGSAKALMASVTITYK